MNEPTWIEPFGERSAELYELVFSVDDHDAEAAYVSGRSTRARPTPSHSWTSRAARWHLEHFSRRFDVSGVDRSTAMLAHARRRLGTAIPLHEADMRELDLGRTFDAITCLSSSIAWLPDREALGRAVRTMAQHLTPGGVLVVEPWDEPTDELDRSPWTRTVRDEHKVVALMETTKLNGDRWLQETHYLVWTDRGIEHVAERTSFCAFRRADMGQAFEDAGLDPRFDDVGPHGRGLWTGLSPRA